ncbi:30S ribosomal protein S12 methylthiotransferase accessory factor YcaO [Thiomicrospira sp. ALE5]|uniref:30S ribosomal protein S12 methylthiotransferase accessory factor YcaO n=1 Tax=Thiomicrospira sp. ALE5 TaxID=748650 RepID=UPI0008E71668|nr:30S ribosomal protein S12 methylthiotransferase accessory factor YcaO [Thiomicrospira sp. ALE5]SFR50475.1 ribosomal protein S12 methylthiotransferase accessory factor [Thiomicrospira sp. ALE5]
MSEQTLIKGKDASLEASLLKMQAIFDNLTIDLDKQQWLNPAENIYSLHIFDKACPALFTNGKGASRKATQASAMGEYLERLSTNYFFSDYYLTLREERDGQQFNDWLYYPHDRHFALEDYRQALTPELWQIYDPHQELTAHHLLSFNDTSPIIRAIAMTEQTTSERVYFPVNMLSNLYASNGLSAGNTPLESAVQGLSEVFERWVKNKILTENICLPEVPDEVIAGFPAISQAIADLQAQGLAVSVRDASLGGRFPVMNVTLFNPKTGQCFASFGAHPLFEVALERTLTESLQGRHLQNLDGFQTPTLDQIAVAEAENLENHFIDSSGLINLHMLASTPDYEFCAWEGAQTTSEQWSELVAKVTELGFKVYRADYQHHDFCATRLIVPGMSEVYPMDELVLKNQNDGRLLREALFSAEQGDYAAVLSVLDQVGFSDHQGVASLIGLMPDPNQAWSVLKIADLRFWTELALQDYEAAADSLYIAKAYATAGAASWQPIYELMDLCLALKLQDKEFGHYKAVLSNLFGQDRVDRAHQHIDGDARFWGLSLGRAMFFESQRHLAMLAVLDKSRVAKQTFGYQD